MRLSEHAGGSQAASARSVLQSSLLRAHRGWAGKFRWHLNARLTRHPRWLDALGARLTVVDAFGAPGDTLLTATVCRQLHERFPRLRLNCVTPNPELLAHDPNLAGLNEPESFFSVWSWYPELAARRDGRMNVLAETFGRLGIGPRDFEYRACVYLTDEERAQGRALIAHATKPVLTVNARSKEDVKNWPLTAWTEAIGALREQFHVVQLGDAAEPIFEGVQRLAGSLSLRESMGVLSHACVHVGGVSFLMHAANGLGVPAVIIFGGRETPANSGYEQNINLAADVPCAACWLQTSRGETCPHQIVCMDKIPAADVVTAALAADRRNKAKP